MCKCSIYLFVNYFTLNYYKLFLQAIKIDFIREHSIFVHGGAGALGQAVIAIALGFGCEVFTTVSDIHKKKFLMKLFPELKGLLKIINF